MTFYYPSHFTGHLYFSVREARARGDEPALIARSMDGIYQLWFAHARNGHFIAESARQITGINGEFETRKQQRAVYSYALRHGIPRSLVFFLESSL